MMMLLFSGERQVKYDVLTSELVNITTTTDICCPGFFEKHKGKCKSKFSKTSFKFMKFYPPAMFKIASEMWNDSDGLHAWTIVFLIVYINCVVIGISCTKTNNYTLSNWFQTKDERLKWNIHGRVFVLNSYQSHIYRCFGFNMFHLFSNDCICDRGQNNTRYQI